MAFSIKTSTNIKATPEIIWEVLMNFSSYPEWNPFIKSVTGDVEVGKKINVDLNGMKFSPKVKEISKNKRFRWLGNTILPGIFDGEHIFELNYDEKSRNTTFIHKENFKGILVPLLKKKLINEIKPAFENMNAALKDFVEK